MSLHLLLGPMFASKSTELITHLKRLSCIGQPVLAINHEWDQKRHSCPHDADDHDDANITSHHGWKFPALFADKLAPIRNHDLYKKANVIAIDEGQFFPDLLKEVTDMVEVDGKHVYVAALNGSAERTLMGQVHELIPFADDIQFFTAFCSICRDGKTPGIFSQRRTDIHNNHVHVGASESYMPVCRAHFANSVKTEHPKT